MYRPYFERLYRLEEVEEVETGAANDNGDKIHTSKNKKSDQHQFADRSVFTYFVRFVFDVCSWISNTSLSRRKSIYI